MIHVDAITFSHTNILGGIGSVVRSAFAGDINSATDFLVSFGLRHPRFALPDHLGRFAPRLHRPFPLERHGKIINRVRGIPKREESQTDPFGGEWRF